MRLGLVDIGDRQPCAFRRRVERDPGRNAARALERDVQPLYPVLAERVLHRRLDPEEHAQ